MKEVLKRRAAECESGGRAREEDEEGRTGEWH